MTTSTTRTTRTVGRHALALAVAAALAGTALPAVAAPTTGPAPTGKHAGSAERIQRIAERGFADVGAAAAAPATCPAGTVRSRSLLSEGFEDGLPDGGEFTYGFSVDTTEGPVGQASAESYHDPTSTDDLHYMFMEDSYATPGARTYLSFLTRGETTFDNAGFFVNSLEWSLDLEPAEYTRITVDVTEATTEEPDGYLTIAFVHVPDAEEVQSLMELDDVQVFSCATPPASGVRGDWTGEGTSDVLGITPDGAMYLYPGRGNGTIGSGTQVGNGWERMTAVLSPGDVTGDRRTDLVARRDDGLLFLYPGRGGGGFAPAIQIGGGWNIFTALTAGGDVDGDGRKDLLARAADGSLKLYSFGPTGRIWDSRQIGTGWGSFTSLVGVGSIDGDRNADLFAVNAAGDLLLYRGSATGLRAGVKVGNGWGGLTAITSPGDLDRDGRDDLLGRTAAGELYVYRSTATGVRSGLKIGTGWNGIARIV